MKWTSRPGPSAAPATNGPDVTDPEATVAYTSYGIDLSASVQKKNIFGCQFHPEKSGSDGLDVLRNFEKICKRGAG